jgi:hypothetical protein
MDINLTGQIAKELVENLKPSLLNNAFIFALITGIMTSAITFITVRKTNEDTEKREEKDRLAKVSIAQKDKIENYHKDILLKRIDLYSQICGLKEVTYHNFTHFMVYYIEAERYLALMTAINRKSSNNIDPVTAESNHRMLRIYTDAHRDAHIELKSYEAKWTENISVIQEKMGLFLIISEKNHEELKDLISSIERLAAETSIVMKNITKFIEDKGENITEEEIKYIINEVQTIYYLDYSLKLKNILNNVVNSLENQIRNEPLWWQPTNNN